MRLATKRPCDRRDRIVLQLVPPAANSRQSPDSKKPLTSSTAQQKKRTTVFSLRVALAAGSVCALVSAQASRRPEVLDEMGAAAGARREKQSDTRVRRGRPSRDDTVRLVASLIRADVRKLDDCTTFAGYPGVRTLVRSHRHKVLPMGVSLKVLLDRAVADVLGLTNAVNACSYRRMAVFLQIWYVEERPVTEVARVLQLERTHVVKTVQRPALELVAHRFLYLAEQADPLADNEEKSANLEDFARISA
jgi:hypothetical protein